MLQVCRHGKGNDMKLEDLLGKELYAQVQAKLDEVNAKEPDKLKHVRYADLSEGEYVGKGQQLTFEEVLENVQSRDHIDQTRAESPLRRADDAIDLDNSMMTIAEQNQWLLDRFNEAVAKARQ